MQCIKFLPANSGDFTVYATQEKHWDWMGGYHHCQSYSMFALPAFPFKSEWDHSKIWSWLFQQFSYLEECQQMWLSLCRKYHNMIGMNTKQPWQRWCLSRSTSTGNASYANWKCNEEDVQNTVHGGTEGNVHTCCLFL